MHASSYGEAVDDTGGRRPAYEAFRSRTGVDPLQPDAKTRQALARWPSGDRPALLPVPLVLDDREFRETIVRGARQRALALQSLFHDIASGELRVFRDTSVPEDVLARIFPCDHGRPATLIARWAGRDREAVRFVYAPDLVRAPDGRWRVLEDNVGCVGGIVDSELVADFYLQSLGVSRHPAVPAGSGLVAGVCAFLARAGRTPASPDVVAVLRDHNASPAAEASRSARALRGLGLRVVDRLTWLEVEPHDGRSGELAAIVNVDWRGFVPESAFVDELFVRRRVPLMTAPDVEALGHKLWLPYMDTIVAFYSGEEAILRTAETAIYERLPDDPSGWVVKGGRGCQGDAVFMLGGMSHAEREALSARLAAASAPEGAIVQRVIRASSLDLPGALEAGRFQIELRPLVYVVGDGASVAGEDASGRAFVNATGRELGNLSRGALHLAVIREPARAGATAPPYS